MDDRIKEMGSHFISRHIDDKYDRMRRKRHDGKTWRKGGQGCGGCQEVIKENWGLVTTKTSIKELTRKWADSYRLKSIF